MSARPLSVPDRTTKPRSDPRLPARTFALLGTVQATLIFTITLISVPLPSIGREFALDSAGLVMVSTAYGLAFSGLLLFGGRLTDRRGGRPTFVAGLVVFGGGSAVAAIAPGFAVLVAARFTEGIGAALVAPAAVALLNALIRDKDVHARAMAVWGGLSALGATAGILISGVVITWVSWRWMFAIPLLVCCVALVLTPRWLPVAASRVGGGLELPGAATATAGTTLVSYGLVATGERAWSSTEVLIPLVIGLMLLASFVVIESFSRDPLLPAAFLADRRRIAGLIAIAFSSAGTAVVFLFLSLYLQQVRTWSPLHTSLAFVPAAISLAAAGRLAGRTIAHAGARLLVVMGLAIATGGLLSLSRLSTHTAYAIGLVPGTVLVCGGAALIFAGAAVLVNTGAPSHQVGLAGGVMNTAMELGPTVGLALLMTVAAARTSPVATTNAGARTATTSGYAWAFGAAGFAFAALAVLMVVAIPRERTT